MRESLEAMGYVVDTKPYIGRVMAAERRPDGSYLGVRDPRVSGLAKAVRTEPDRP
jgi:gamma-glutamyltranspeptidase